MAFQTGALAAFPSLPLVALVVEHNLPFPVVQAKQEATEHTYSADPKNNRLSKELHNS